ncbi:MAG: hypothetical protein A2W28_00355 [Gammaproteobacteria bacterium RBG_16_51_14]|nr:MAG: hypothetical protein A2W28_00355 [Gammaproteobacteria bacterium RBG_16_51_14]
MKSHFSTIRYRIQYRPPEGDRPVSPQTTVKIKLAMKDSYVRQGISEICGMQLNIVFLAKPGFYIYSGNLYQTGNTIDCSPRIDSLLNTACV